MALSWGEWKSITERSAAVEYGKRHSKTITFLRFAPYYAAALAAGGIGWVLYKMWTKAGAMLAATEPVASSVDTSGIPALVWAGALVLLVLSVMVVRGPRNSVRPLGIIFMQAIAVLVGWLGLGAFALGAF
jgi:hypothetical protein